jgi:hypothetical protein
MPNPYSSFDYSPQFVFEGSGFAANSVNSSHIITATITGTDIATGTITDANIAVGTITEAKLSSALQTKLSNFNTRITALETPPPPPANTGWYGNLYIVNENIGGGGRYFAFSVGANNGAVEVNYEYVYAGETYTIEVPIGSRFPNMNSVITFQVNEYQQDSAGYENAVLYGATYQGTLYTGEVYITPYAPNTNITINIPIDNDY